MVSDPLLDILLLRVLALYSCGERGFCVYAVLYSLDAVGRKAKICLYSLYCLEFFSKVGFAMTGQILAKCMW